MGEDNKNNKSKYDNTRILLNKYFGVANIAKGLHNDPQGQCFVIYVHKKGETVDSPHASPLRSHPETVTEKLKDIGVRTITTHQVQSLGKGKEKKHPVLLIHAGDMNKNLEQVEQLFSQLDEELRSRPGVEVGEDGVTYVNFAKAKRPEASAKRTAEAACSPGTVVRPAIERWAGPVKEATGEREIQ